MDLKALEEELLIRVWRKEYTTVTPHSALGYKPPGPAALVVTPAQSQPAELT